jgi:thymidylate kinase
MGPDGSGKSTIARLVARSSCTPARVVYMGLSEHRLPRPARLRAPGLRETFLLAALWTHYLAARLFQAQGGLVLFDRYTYDALLPPPQHLTTWQHMTRWLRAHSCPAPDMVVLLDVPGQVMYRRKGEHTPQHLEGERSDFLALARRLPRT